ncbi:MAG TPA: hypothetical protein VIO13_08215, partial [Candidatus Dormibacteraeota bacterium]
PRTVGVNPTLLTPTPRRTWRAAVASRPLTGAGQMLAPRLVGMNPTMLTPTPRRAWRAASAFASRPLTGAGQMLAPS